MTLVAIVAILDVALIVLAFAIVFASKAGQRRECRRLRVGGGTAPRAIARKPGANTVEPYRAV
ncbi:MAG TPA: hypothetical protein VFK14_12160 [Solirubrobacterales bacterium]|nr:hypothetical protein [Solirubrobacterales bacterium]